MKRKCLWLLVSTVLILAMLLTACKTEEPTTTTATTTTTAATTAATTIVTTTATTMATTTTTTSEKPTYGGSMTVSIAADAASVESYSTNPHVLTRFIYDALLIGDVTVPEDKWPAYGMYWPKQYTVGCLAESWEEIDVSTTIIHLRQGVKFHNIPPVNGRELTSADVVYTFARDMSPASAIATSQNIRDIVKSITPIDDYTFKYVINPEKADGGWYSILYRSNTWIYPREVVEKYGNLSNPIGQVGTGPYIIKDYIPGSAYIYEKNSNYWGMDPRYPENRLPYIDKVSVMVIGDLSTQLAALRTGKLDRLSSVSVSQEASLTKTNPALMHRLILPDSCTYISPRNDVVPFGDVRVRKALSMAIDRDAIVNQYYQGAADYEGFYVPQNWDVHIPLDQFPPEIAEVVSYNPVKAKQLMTEAGYPDGFKTEMQVSSTSTTGIDVAQLIKNWWKENLNVDVDIKVLESANWSNQRQKHSFPQMQMGGGGIGLPHSGLSYIYNPPGEFRIYNNTEFHDNTYNALYERSVANYKLTKEEAAQAWYDLNEYIRKMTPIIDLPTGHTVLYWQPWLKGHRGQGMLCFSSYGDLYKYMWIDQSLKKSITGK